MRSIKQLKNIKGKKVLVRVDFNVPILNGNVEDDFRIKKALPTIKNLKQKGAKIILIGHLGKGGESFAPVAKVLSSYIKSTFVPQVVGDTVTQAVSKMKNGDIVLLENLRNEKGEKDNDKNFAKKLASLGDLYINEAFSVDHRADASLVLLPKLLPAYAGIQLEAEVKNLSLALKNTKHPFVFILGGAKFSTKIPLIKKYLKLADTVFIGGALLNDFLKAKGYEVGKSLVDTENYGIEKFLKNKKLLLPTDVLVRDGGKIINKKVSDVGAEDFILDVGHESVKNLNTLIKQSKFVLWNGPLGKYEDGGAGATKEILKTLAASKAKSIVGGGDTVALISEMKLEKKLTFVSTGGGATLDFLANGNLVAIKALK